MEEKGGGKTRVQKVKKIGWRKKDEERKKRFMASSLGK